MMDVKSNNIRFNLSRGPRRGGLFENADIDSDSSTNDSILVLLTEYPELETGGVEYNRIFLF